jgi:catechol 2,3-dioxygenase-like lactoylglutathione lyase family enzyme
MSLKDIRNFDYTILLCENLAKTRGFYKDVLGFQLESDSENWVTFRVGSTLLTLRPRGDWLCWNDGPVASGSAAVQLAFRVPPSAVDGCHAELVARDVPIVRAPTDIPAVRHRTLFFRDPEDNVIEIYAEY